MTAFFESVVEDAARGWKHSAIPDDLNRVYSMLQEGGVSDPGPIYDFIEELKDRKLQEFLDDDRIILDAEAHAHGDGSFYLVAVAAGQAQTAADTQSSSEQPL